MVRGATIIAIMALCGAATAIAGPIGFVGLVVPHVVRLLVGSDIARVLPLSLVYGPVLVLASDILPADYHSAATVKVVPLAVCIIEEPSLEHLTEETVMSC